MKIEKLDESYKQRKEAIRYLKNTTPDTLALWEKVNEIIDWINKRDNDETITS